MKKVAAMLLALTLTLSLSACGGGNPEELKTEAPVTTQANAETTLTPREQFEKQKEAMDELLNRTEGNTEAEVGTEYEVVTENETAAETEQPSASGNFSAGGMTLQLDSSFQAQFNAGDELMTYWYSNGDSFGYTMKIGISPMGNAGGYKTSQEAAEAIAAQKPDVRTVETANGIYYIVQTGQLSAIKAYYVDASGYYWVVDGMTSTSVNFEDYKAQLIQFCTSGMID